MGRGGEKAPSEGGLGLRRNSWSFNSIKGLQELSTDLSTLRHLWFSNAGKKHGADHAKRLDAFYGPQAAA